MQVNKLLPVFMVFLLTSCGTVNEDKRVKINSSNPGGLISITCEDFYNLVITENSNAILLLEAEGCSKCVEASTQCDAYARKNKCNIYTINILEADANQYQYLYDATRYVNDAYGLPSYGSTIDLPLCMVFAYKGVVIEFNDNFVTNLDSYVVVNS